MFDLSACKGLETMTSRVVAIAEYSSVEMRGKGMDFISDLPKARRDFNVIWAIEEKLTKAAHSIPDKATYRVDQWAQLHVKEVVRLHGSVHCV